MNLLNYFRRKAGHQDKPGWAQPMYRSKVKIYLAGQLVATCRTSVRAKSNREAQAKMQKAITKDLTFKIKTNKR